MVLSFFLHPDLHPVIRDPLMNLHHVILSEAKDLLMVDLGKTAPPSANTKAEGSAPLVRAARPKGRPPSGRCRGGSNFALIYWHPHDGLGLKWPNVAQGVIVDGFADAEAGTIMLRRGSSL